MRRLTAMLLVAASTLVDCKSERAVAPRGEGGVVVHAVLNPAASSQFVLLERVLTGRVPTEQTRPFDPDDPIVSGGGDPISGAEVTVTNEAGLFARLRELPVLRGDGKGAGVYTFVNRAPVRGDTTFCCLSVAPTVRYTLRVVTAERVVTGATTVPDAPVAPIPLHSDSFNVDRDTLRLSWSRVPTAARYVLQVATPHGTFQLFNDEADVRLPGALRDDGQRDLPRVFIPGFREAILVAAVDANYFDYYRSRNDPFTGTGIITHLDGGTGVFGAWVPLASHLVEVTADTADPLEGTYRPDTNLLGLTPEEMRLYVGGQDGAATHLSGYYRGINRRFPLDGSLADGRFTLAMLAREDLSDTAHVLTGVATRGGLVVRMDGGAEVVFRK